MGRSAWPVSMCQNSLMGQWSWMARKPEKPDSTPTAVETRCRMMGAVRLKINNRNSPVASENIEPIEKHMPAQDATNMSSREPRASPHTAIASASTGRQKEARPLGLIH